MLTRNMRYTCLFMVLLTVSLCSVASAVTVRFEAEDAIMDGAQTPGTSYAGYSGTGYINLTTAGGLDFIVNVRDAGDYPLIIRYWAQWGDKELDILINGATVGPPIVFTGTSTWTDYVFGDISLNAGDNIVRIQVNWSWVMYDYIEIDGFPAVATDPVPENHTTVGTGLAQICWTNPADDPGPVTSDVYFGTTDPNALLPNYGLTKIATGTSATCVNVPVALSAFETYYWVVDSWDGSTLTQGMFWDFNTNNTAPTADAGPDLHVGLGNDSDPNSATATLDAVLTTDDMLPAGILNYLWEQVSGPAGVIVNPYDTEATNVNLSAVGTYEFRLTVDDSDLDSVDTVLVTVYESSCEAHMSQNPGLIFDLGDISQDCHVAEEDVWTMLWYWLECNAADCQ